MSSELTHILTLLKSTFEKNAWYGPSVQEVLKDITPSQSTQRISNTHSIIELVAHMTAWRTFVVKKLEGDVDYKVDDALNFPTPFNWETTLKELHESQAKLIAAIQNFDSSLLHDAVPNSSSGYTFFTLLHGIIHHDIYHTGQIMLIKKSK
ncbi:MAG TPA: DinB family protein [Chryseolinea sp.]|nr:DinB family protein [Chryseolinea sp.]HPM31673.1 DinB family protein [Chryseolinea sp.]